jgi:transcriptional regulator with XRE-family HTH domain
VADQEEFILRNRIVGVLLQDARVRADKSKRECAEVLGVSTSTITAYEKGESSVSLPELEVLAYFLDVPVEHFWNSERAKLLGEEEEELPKVEEILEIRNRIIGVLLRQARMDEEKSQRDLAEALDCAASRISDYEYGRRPIPFSELETLARTLNRPLDYFLGDRTGTMGKREKEREFYRSFRDLPEEFQEFVVKPINQSYLEVAMKLSEMPAGALRAIAEGLLEITY